MSGWPFTGCRAVGALVWTRPPRGPRVPRLSCGHLGSRYQPPNLAISTLYWKAWPLLLVVAAFNPENIGERPRPPGPAPAWPRPLSLCGPRLSWPFHGRSIGSGWGPGGEWGGAGARARVLPPPVTLPPRPGRLGRVPHAEDAHGDGDDQVSRSPPRGARTRGLGHVQNVCRGSRQSGPQRAPVSLKWESAWVPVSDHLAQWPGSPMALLPHMPLWGLGP